jgi:hypothetical protein
LGVLVSTVAFRFVVDFFVALADALGFGSGVIVEA